MQHTYFAAIAIAIFSYTTISTQELGSCQAPENLTATRGNCFIKLNWTPVEGASYYAIYAGENRIGFSHMPSYIHETGCQMCFECPPGSFSVTSICDSYESNPSHDVSIHLPCLPSLQLSATTNECNTIVLEWGVLGDWDSDTYAIYKSKTIDPEQAFFVGYTDFTTFIDSEVLPFQTYYYWVSGYSTDGCEITDDASGQSIECLDCSGDINGDTFVDMNDLLLLLDDWGACP